MKGYKLPSETGATAQRPLTDEQVTEKYEALCKGMNWFLSVSEGLEETVRLELGAAIINRARDCAEMMNLRKHKQQVSSER